MYEKDIALRHGKGGNIVWADGHCSAEISGYRHSTAGLTSTGGLGENSCDDRLYNPVSAYEDAD